MQYHVHTNMSFCFSSSIHSPFCDQLSSTSSHKSIRMKVVLVLIFAFIMLFCITTLSVIIKYLKNKAICKKVIQDRVQVDLAFLTITFVSFFSTFIIFREFFGHFESVRFVRAVFWYDSKNPKAGPA